MLKGVTNYYVRVAKLDIASDYESEDCGFNPRLGFIHLWKKWSKKFTLYTFEDLNPHDF